MTDLASVIVRPTVAEPGRAARTYRIIPEYAEADAAYQTEYVDALARLIVWAHTDGMEIADWLRAALETASREVGGMAVLLARRPGSWEAALVAQLGYNPDIDDPSILG